VGYTFNPYQRLNPRGGDEAFTAELMAHGRQALGAQLVLENDSLRVGFLSGQGLYAQMYATMRQLGGPIGFQTAVLRKVGSLTGTLQGAAQLAASSVELPPGFEAQLTPAQMAAYGAALPASG
jgi:hypothetical protein